MYHALLLLTQSWVSINNNKVTQDYTKGSLFEKYTYFEEKLKNKHAPLGCFPSVQNILDG